MEKKGFNQQDYINEYNKQNYTRIDIRIKKSDEDNLLEKANQNGYKTIAAYAKALLLEQL